jgi:hypothetical protein
MSNALQKETVILVIRRSGKILQHITYPPPNIVIYTYSTVRVHKSRAPFVRMQRRLKFVQWCRILVWLQYRTCFMSLFWHLEFLSGSRLPGNVWKPGVWWCWYEIYTQINNHTIQASIPLLRMFSTCRLRLKCDGTRAETRFRLSAKRTSPFKSAGASVQASTGSRGVRISGSNAGYTKFRGSVKDTGYTLHSPVSPSLPLPRVTVWHHISIGVYKPRYHDIWPV